ncbi:unnamed protein product [Rhizophagus irregularis]|nr:unnamed protein product [Rhizophagus irregularis]
MATKTATPKTRKPKANNFVLVLEQFLEKHNLTADSTPEQLSEHAPELDTLLPADDWMARSNDENEIIAGVARQSTFRVKLAEGGVDPTIIEEFAKDQKRIQESNEIQRKHTKKRMAKAPRIPKHFSLANVSKRIQNMDVSKIPTREDLADVIVMLSMRPSEVTSLQIKRYEPDEPLGIDLPNIPAWYKEGYSWYCTGYKKADGRIPCPLLSMEKNPERARELLIWIQDAIKAKKLSDPVFTESGTRSAWPFNEFLKQEPYRSIPRELRRYGKRHASRIYGGKNATPEELKRLSKIALRQESDRLDAGDNYAMGDTESEDSGPEDEHNSEPESESAENDEISDIINMYSY